MKRNWDILREIICQINDEGHVILSTLQEYEHFQLLLEKDVFFNKSCELELTKKGKVFLKMVDDEHFWEFVQFMSEKVDIPISLEFIDSLVSRYGAFFRLDIDELYKFRTEKDAKKNETA